ncbi:MAG: universal stress protein [bacterium]
MINLKKILIPTDMSDHSLAGFEHGLSFGLLYGAKVYVLYVAPELPLMPGLDGIEGNAPFQSVRTEEESVAKLNQFIAQHFGTDRKIISVIRRGVAENEIIRFAEDENVDLIVLATHGWTGMKHILLGSVAERLVRHSTIPVLTVKPAPMQEAIVREEDLEKELHFQ